MAPFWGKKTEAQRREAGTSPGWGLCSGLVGSTPIRLSWPGDVQDGVWRTGVGEELGVWRVGWEAASLT